MIRNLIKRQNIKTNLIGQKLPYLRSQVFDSLLTSPTNPDSL